MVRESLCLLLAGALALPSAQAQGAGDPELTKGIAQVDDGDYDGAILTLDNAARRLAGDPKRVADLSQAYLYLGIAYIGKGHEAAAKAKFREAISQIKTLSLSPDKFPPKVIDLFEAAKEEEARNAPAAPAPSPASAPPPEKKGSGGKILLIVGGVAAAGGIAIAAGGGGGGSSAPATTPTTTLPVDTRTTETFTASICGYSFPGRANGSCSYVATFPVIVSKAGTLDAKATWADATVIVSMILYDQNGQTVKSSTPAAGGQSQLTAQVTPQTGCTTCTYQLQASRSDDKGTKTFHVTVTHP